MPYAEILKVDFLHYFTFPIITGLIRNNNGRLFWNILYMMRTYDKEVIFPMNMKGKYMFF